MMPPPGRPILPSSALDDGGGADDLHAHGMVRPANRVTERTGPLAPRIARDRIGNRQEHLARTAGHTLDHFGRVARIMPAHDLIDAFGIGQRRVRQRRPLGHAFEVAFLCRVLRRHVVVRHRGGYDLALILPAVVLVGTGSRIEAGEYTVILLRVAIRILDDVSDVRIGHREFAEPQIVFQDVADDPPEERDIAARPYRRVEYPPARRCA